MDLESNPRPRISLKIGYFLTDTTVEGSGNFYVIPGSHLWNALELPEDEVENPEGTTSGESAARYGGIFRSADLAFRKSQSFRYHPKGAVLRL